MLPNLNLPVIPVDSAGSTSHTIPKVLHDLSASQRRSLSRLSYYVAEVRSIVISLYLNHC